MSKKIPKEAIDFASRLIDDLMEHHDEDWNRTVAKFLIKEGVFDREKNPISFDDPLGDNEGFAPTKLIRRGVPRSSY